ncbi:hypothetical protein OG884_22205 [Streptosporangium sp. NBC_01755]|uniref:hypothetical protein n=1 Tax=unclassified Streptosporangium TaxID=2632669 RepID=UPI002DDA6483|nr:MULTISPECIES: hypothetical protein [unclassified Streptosporangium]WSA24324.1 hypothetical protein OIE13_25720 [Streptosporangium sp. NBC_01810]WSC97602.1 hypothetical protein OG884_22205 [Streptosporangium sp. NBC_01755]
MLPDHDRPEPRSVHRTDWMALLSGMLFIAAGIVFIIRPSVQPLGMLTVLVGGLGLAGLVAILAKVIRR